MPLFSGDAVKGMRCELISRIKKLDRDDFSGFVSIDHNSGADFLGIDDFAFRKTHEQSIGLTVIMRLHHGPPHRDQRMR